MTSCNLSTEQSYYQRYCSTAKRFETIGCILVGGAVLLDLVTSASVRWLSLLFAIAGMVPLVIGGSCLRPHNVIKAFAQQCVQQPSDEFARGLLDALRAERKVKLVSSSITMVENAVDVYAMFEESDPELIKDLQEALKTRVDKKIF